MYRYHFAHRYRTERHASPQPPQHKPARRLRVIENSELDRVCSAIHRSGMTEQEIADAAGVDRTTILRWLRGAVGKPHKSAIAAVMRTLRLGLAEH